jgi:hypothetical protein
VEAVSQVHKLACETLCKAFGVSTHLDNGGGNGGCCLRIIADVMLTSCTTALAAAADVGPERRRAEGPPGPRDAD